MKPTSKSLRSGFGSWARRVAALSVLAAVQVLAAGRIGGIELSDAQAHEGAAYSPEPMVALSGNHPDSDLSGFARAARDRKLDLEIVFALTNPNALDGLLADQQDPASTRYHQWLTPDEFSTSFGPTQSNFQAVARWLESEGLAVASADIKDRAIRFTGTVAKVEQVFGTQVVASGDSLSYGNRLDPLIPARFEGVVARIEGLDNMTAAMSSISQAPADFMELPPETGSHGAGPDVYIDGQGPFFGPSDFYTFYDEQPVLNAGIDGSSFDCVAVVEDSNFLSTAVTGFDEYFGLGEANVETVFADNKNPGRNGDQIETLLDIEWAHVVAPGVPIHVYIGDARRSRFGPIVDGIQQAVTDNVCGAISVSFGLCGFPNSFYSTTAENIFSQAASQGQTVFISSGDQGAAGIVFNAAQHACVVARKRHVNELGASPLVVSVGGTQFTPNYDFEGNDESFVEEFAWNTPPPYPGATGGGASVVFPKPSYQQGVTPNDGARDVPDVAMIAGPPGVPLGITGGKKHRPELACCISGTSLASPVWAAMQALTGKRQGTLNPAFYANNGPRGVRDVTSGNNQFRKVAGFQAGPGYDQVTGWGSVDIADYVGIAPAPMVTPIPAEPGQ
jgi:pseudomonalisin